MKKHLEEALLILSVLVCVPALISLVQHIFHVGLTPFLLEVVTFYRHLFEQMVGGLRSAIPIFPSAPLLGRELISEVTKVEITSADLYCLSFWGSGAATRAIFFAVPKTQDRRERLQHLVYGCLLSLFLGISGIGLVAVAALPLAMTFPQILVRGICRYVRGTIPDNLADALVDYMEAKHIRPFVHGLQVTGWISLAAVFIFYVANHIGFNI